MTGEKFRTAGSVLLMVLAGLAGFFVGAAMNDAMGGAVLFSMIAWIACVVYTLDNRGE